MLNGRLSLPRLLRVEVLALAVSLLPVPRAAVQAAEQAIVPHRALYQMQLAGTRTGSSVTGVSGRMAFEWADACEGRGGGGGPIR